jgi:hypothetical protein
MLIGGFGAYLYMMVPLPGQAPDSDVIHPLRESVAQLAGLAGAVIGLMISGVIIGAASCIVAFVYLPTTNDSGQPQSP